MSWVFAVKDGMSQIVHVVSMLEVIMRLGDTVFQSREVNGAVWSGVLELESKARGVSLCDAVGWLRPVMELPPGVTGVSEGSDHRRK